jgi:hypothetical protein
MSTVHLVTCTELPDGDEDAKLLVDALARVGVTGAWVAWDDPAVDWSAALAVIRSTWDYSPRRDEFLEWTRTVPRLANAADVVAWNSDKTYLRDLAEADIPIVPTEWVAPGEMLRLPIEGEFVLKPSVGAGSKGAGRFAASAAEAAHTHTQLLHDAGRVVLVQPYLAQVDDVGETALIYVDGQFSHAVSKAAMLPESTVNPLGSGSSHNLFVEERMSSHEASSAELALGARVVEFVRERFGADQLYTRVDLLPSSVGPVVIELELAEPSLFLSYADGAADRFTQAIAARA